MKLQCQICSNLPGVYLHVVGREVCRYCRPRPVTGGGGQEAELGPARVHVARIGHGASGGHGQQLGAEAHAQDRHLLRKRLLDLGFEIVTNTPAEFASFQAAEFARWQSLISARGIKAD